MTIKQFTLLCGCNPQTLRYYDHVDLLKPVKVDQWSGYRYYDEDQAIVFVKIKNLQAAGFAIDEIRELLDKDTLAIYTALEAKVIEQEKRLQEIIKIQMSYKAEMDSMRKKLETIQEEVRKSMELYDPMEEFGVERVVARDHILHTAFKSGDGRIRCQRPGAGAVQDDVHRADFGRNRTALRVRDLAAEGALKGGTVLQR